MAAWERDGDFVIVEDRDEAEPSALALFEQEQAVAAALVAGLVVTDIDDVFAAVGELRLLKVHDLGTRVRTDAVLLPVDDEVHGALFSRRGVEARGEVHDGAITSCSVPDGEATVCVVDADCESGEVCVGVVEHRGVDVGGRCKFRFIPAVPARRCASLAACDEPGFEEGLMCVGLTRDGEGDCERADNAGVFVDEGLAAAPEELPGGTSMTRRIVVSGLGQRDADVVVELDLRAADVASLAVSVTNPASTTVVLFGAGDAAGTSVVLARDDGIVDGFDGSGPANGIWEVTIQNDGPGVATLHDLALRVTSRGF